MAKIDPVTDVTGFLDYPSTRARSVDKQNNCHMCHTPYFTGFLESPLIDSRGSEVGAR
jgi:hypothetical protein